MRRAWVVAMLVHVAIARAEPPRLDHRALAIGGLAVTLPVKTEIQPLRSKQRKIFKSSPTSDAPPALLARDSSNKWLLGVPGLQRLTKVMAPQAGLTLTLFGARF